MIQPLLRGSCMDYDAIVARAVEMARKSPDEVRRMNLSPRESWQVALAAASLGAGPSRELTDELFEAVLDFGTLAFGEPCSTPEPACVASNVVQLRGKI
jgi:hypothetical protein